MKILYNKNPESFALVLSPNTLSDEVLHISMSKIDAITGSTCDMLINELDVVLTKDDVDFYDNANKELPKAFSLIEIIKTNAHSLDIYMVKNKIKTQIENIKKCILYNKNNRLKAKIFIGTVSQRLLGKKIECDLSII